MFQQQFWAEGTLFGDSSNNELLNINLANGYGQTGILISGLHKCVAVGGNGTGDSSNFIIHSILWTFFYSFI